MFGPLGAADCAVLPSGSHFQLPPLASAPLIPRKNEEPPHRVTQEAHCSRFEQRLYRILLVRAHPPAASPSSQPTGCPLVMTSCSAVVCPLLPFRPASVPTRDVNGAKLCTRTRLEQLAPVRLSQKTRPQATGRPISRPISPRGRPSSASSRSLGFRGRVRPVRSFAWSLTGP